MINEVAYPPKPWAIGQEHTVGLVTKVYVGDNVWKNKSAGHHELRISALEERVGGLEFETLTEALEYEAISALDGKTVRVLEMNTTFAVGSSTGVVPNLTSKFHSTADADYALTRVVSGSIDVSQGLVNDTNVADNDLRVEELLAYGVEVTHEETIKVVQPIRVMSNQTLVTKTGRGRVHNVSLSTPPRFIGQGTYYVNCLSIGNYGGETSTTYGALWVLDYHTFANAGEGDTEVIITDGSEGNFATGQIVIIKSSETFTVLAGGLAIPKYCQVNKVLEVVGTTVKLEKALNFAFNASSIAVADDSFTGLDGHPAYIAENVTIKTGLITDRADNWSVAHVSGYNCDINILNVKADNRGVGCNPLAYSKVKLRSSNPLLSGVTGTSPASGLMLEIAHLNNNVEVDGEWPVGTFNCSECGSDIHGRVVVGDGHMGTARKHRVKVQFTNRKWTESTNVLPTVILARECEGSELLQGSRVVAGLSNAVIIGEDSIDHKIIGCTAKGGGDTSKDPNKAAINIEQNAVNPIVSSNNVGDVAKNYSDRIVNQSPTAIVEGNNSIASLPKLYDRVAHSTGGATGLVALSSYTIDPNRFTEGSAVEVHISGSVSGNTDFKSLRVKLASGGTETEMFNIPFTAGQSGRFTITALLGSVAYAVSGANSTARLDSSYVHPVDGAESTAAVFNYDRANTLQLIVYGDAVNSADTVAIQVFRVTPVADQFAIT